MQPPQIPSPSSPQGMGPASPSPQDQKKVFLQKYGKVLKTLFDNHVAGAIDREKVFQYAKARRNDFYYRGLHHLVPTYSGTGDVVDYKPVSGALYLKSTLEDRAGTAIYDYSLNDFRGDLRKWVAILGSRSPNVRARASWASDEEAVTRAALADDAAGYLRSQWDGDAANRYLALSLGKNSTSFLYTPYRSSKEKYGSFLEPVWGEELQKLEPDYFECPSCGERSEGNPCQACGAPIPPEGFREGESAPVPIQVGEQEHLNGTVELEIHSVFTVTTPFYVKDLESTPWLWLHLEEDASKLVDQYPERGLEERMKGGSGGSLGSSSSALGKQVRAQTSSPQGIGVLDRPWRWQKNKIWLRPCMYNYLLQQGEGEARELLQILKGEYSKGLSLTFVDDLLVEAEEEGVTEVWSEAKPETSEYLWADPVFDDYIQGQDIMNDALNLFVQIMETSIPVTMFDPNVLDAAKVKQGFSVSEFVPLVPGSGPEAQNGFVRIPTSEPKPELLNLLATIRGNLREIVGLLPVVFGAEGPAQTAEEARRRLNQALLVLSTTWNEMRIAWARAYRNGVKQLAKYSLGRLVSTNGDPESATVKEVDSISSLLKGGWYFECDQSIPMGWTQLRDFVTSLFQENPVLAEAMGATDPDNLSLVHQGIGIPGWKIPGMTKKKYILSVVDKLLQGEATPSPDGMGLSPSIPFDPFQYPPDLTVKVIQEWLMEKGLELEGTPGYLNVLAFGREAQKILMPPEAPAPPQGPKEIGAGQPPLLPPPSQEDQASLAGEEMAPPPAMDAEPLGLDQVPPGVEDEASLLQ